MRHSAVAESSFTPLQEWEGYVVDVGQDTFTARLLDLTAGDEQEEEEADFPFSVLSISDRQKVKPGTLFHWAIGAHQSRISFCRLPVWTEDNQRKAAVLAATLKDDVAAK